MSIAEKLTTIAENEQKVFEAGKNKGKELLANRVNGTLKEITAADLAGITKISQNALSYLPITTLTLPNTLTTIEKSGVCYCERLKQIIIPPNVTTIGDTAFNGCWALNRVYIQGDNAKTFGAYAFNVHQDVVITIYSHTPPTIQTSTFLKSCTIRVPKGCIDVYKNATNWAAFADCLEEY